MEFSYKAISKEGRTTNGSIEAENQDRALSYLKESGYTILSVNAKSVPVTSSFSALFSRVNFSQIVDFTRQMSIMLSSGLTLIDAFEIFKRQSDNVAFLKLMQEIDSDIKAGLSFSEALKKHPHLFSNLYISLIKAGEASGKLDEIMKKLAINLERQRTFQSKVKGAMIYPIIIICAMSVVMFIMLTFVLPKLLDVYKDFNVKLPIMTVFLINVSTFFNKFWWLIILTVIFGIVMLMKIIHSKSGKRLFDRISLHVPLINSIIRISALVDTTRTLSILIGAGVSILEALDIITETTNNIIYQEAFRRIKHGIETGESLGNAMEASHIFPPILVQMTTVGEQTGHLDETLGHLASYFESESEIAIKSLTTLIEPTLLIVLGLGVGFVVIAVITPIFSLTSSL
ncbi:hypothetical protein A3B02_00900 [Candidatus Roizmanbacteria bacterium RIFCSPLOWO2_01_FULL_42_14]|uniref:Type II secretion system protein GspF domain-containing protein n=4 Tax=Candidatus Roizmaniibacteriota TaxID=1752723 RepID=A0A1F7JV52_9BACT|nr:MAG: hypothetical protein A3D08_02145 [Candidatus Roizmanbacteria bacterium RIFCSPHIGHO2_02_FULL_43_11]OGK37719.1 MAG: hypothetical protein A3F32_02250 [Candidatus Roizmanbacteria bacterium RIFCSPHIGHO2_12_FULL_42_10]OGK51396.1 MAG: hypothetical protein A3B02_00900 [Candidatus Roizmanbacteria bacterium RIFCSPLOWO2_01_FULL_42_14]OGK59470.1 MAG: hypothetical protein A3I56_01010 [Candidatus Roizmanbacteria bacterium RIFCSPLOWO2_02_FULL_43_10]